MLRTYHRLKTFRFVVFASAVLGFMVLGISVSISAVALPARGQRLGSHRSYSPYPSGLYSANSAPCPSWSIVPSANVSGAENVLNSVSAVSANDIWAVGYSVVGGVASTLTVHWDGKTWTVIPSPNPQPSSNFLDGVVAFSPTNAWAVGDSGTSRNPGTIILHWDGKTWTPATLPALEPSGNSLYSISAVSPNDIWAAGVRGNFNSRSGGLIMHYNGVDWSVVPSPGSGNASILYAISARASNDVWAVGSVLRTTSSLVQTFAQHWNGSAWSTIEKPLASGSANALWSVAAVEPDNVWAVGSHCPSNLICPNHENIIEKWDGKVWQSYGFAPNGGEDNNLASMVAVSANDMWAVGYGKTADKKRPFFVHWNGTGWAGVPGPDPGETSTLNGIAKIPGGNLIAVGTIGDDGARRSFVEMYADNCAAPTKAPTNTPVSVASTPTAIATMPPTPLPGSGSQIFSETGKTVNGLFLDYWNNNPPLLFQ